MATPLSEEARRQRAEIQAKKKAIQALKEARELEAKNRDVSIVASHEKNAKKVEEEIEQIAEDGRKRLAEGIRGYETLVTVYLSMSAGNRKFEVLSGYMMTYVGSKLCLWPMSKIGQFFSHLGEDMMRSVKSWFVDTTPPYEVPKVQFFVDLKDDNTLDFYALEQQVGFSDKSKVTGADKLAFTNAFADWIEAVDGGKYEIHQIDPDDMSKGFEIYAKPAPGSAPGARGPKLTQADFRTLRDDPRHGFTDFLTNRFGDGFEALSAPPPRPTPG